MSTITLISAGVVALDVLIVLSALSLVFARSRAAVLARISRNAIPLIIVLAFASVAGTLYMEYAALLTPCHLCWWQRVFMYPILVIALVALVKGTKANGLADYVLALAIPGFAVALYQHLLQVLPAGALIPCDASNDCAIRSVFDFGFVTIPWMAISVFAALIFVALCARFAKLENTA